MRRSRHPHALSARTGRTAVATAVAALLVAGQLATATSASALPGEATFVDLGSAASYSVLGGLGVANTGAGTVLSGDLGLSPSGVITGFPPGTVEGETHDKDTVAETAQADRDAAYADAAGQTSTTTFTGDQAGKTFLPGVHTTAAAFTNTGTITLDADGDSSAVFVFQVGAAFSSAAASKVVLTDGALANNVVWQVVGAVSLGANARFVGTFLGAGAITFGDGASIKGRALTPGTVAVTNSPFTEPVDDFDAPVVGIDGGPARSTNDPTPSISGTANEPAGTAVTVTVGGRTLRTTVRDGGVWDVSASPLSSGPHDVLAEVTDPSRNVGTASQVLTVDLDAPVLEFDTGSRTATNDTTPLISGTTDEPAGSTVQVAVDSQTLTATVGYTGDWSVVADPLSESHHGVTAWVSDAAGNTGTAYQVLTVDLTVPVVAIDGGSTRSTDDTSPWIYGTTAEKAGTQVDVTIGGQDLDATVLPGGTWGVSATTLPAGTHQVVASITDAAQNTGTASQELRIGGIVAPEATYRPDAAIRIPPQAYVGTRVYGDGNQMVVKALSSRIRKGTFEVNVTNEGDAAERVEVLGTSGTRKFAVTYLAGGDNVTGEVTGGTHRTQSLAPGQSERLVLRVTRTRAADRGDRRTFTVRATSTHRTSTHDTVAAVVRATR